MADFRSSAFRTEDFSLVAGNNSCRFPVLTARDWLEVFCSRNWVVPAFGKIPELPQELFLDEIESGRMVPAEVLALARAALSESAGRPWWEAERLVNSCFADGGRLLGTVLMSGADPSRMTLAVFLACVWATLTKGQDAAGITKLEAELIVPPPEATEEERAGLEDDMFSMVERARSIPGVHIG